MKNAPSPIKQEFEDDHELIRNVLNGDNLSFDALVIRHKDKVFNLCYWFLSDYQEADDVAQDIFIKVFQSLKNFRFEAAFSTWLFRIAMNTCKNRVNTLEYRFKKWTDRLDAKGLDAGKGLTAEGINGYALTHNPEKDAQSPYVQLKHKEMAVRINEVISTLSKDKKTVIVLRDIQGLSYEEISAVTGIKIGTVKSKLARARALLQKELKDDV